MLWLPPIVYMAVIFHLSAESNPLPELTTHVWDKALHTTAYAGLGVLFCRALAGDGLGWIAAVALAVCLTSAYGASDEYHQSFVPNRDADIHDWYADTLGGTAGAAGYAALASRIRRSRL